MVNKPKTLLTPLLLLVILTIPTVWALSKPGFYTSHDGETHTARLANFYLALKEGQFPPQLAPSLFGGYGFPIFIFIYPLPYFVGALFHTFGISYTDAAELTMASAQILSVIFFYLFFLKESGNKLAAFLSSLFFVWAPYRMLMIYVRGAFAESFAYLFIPLVLLGISSLAQKSSKFWIGFASLSLAGLLLSHQLVSAMFLPVITWFFVFKLIMHSKNRLHLLRDFFISIALSLLASAYIYLPAIFERSHLRFDEFINYFNDHFVSFKQLIRSPWGYGFSHPGTIDDAMSFQIGLTHLSLLGLTLLFLILTIKQKKFLKNNFSLIWWLIPPLLASLLMVKTPLTVWIWNNVPGVSVVDFPWRFLGVVTTCTAILSGYLITKLKFKQFFFAIFFLLLLYSNRNHLRINQTVTFSDDYFENYPATATWRNEFLPTHRQTSNWTGLDSDYTIKRGEAEVSIVHAKTTEIEAVAEVKTEAEILLHRLYFPGWQVFIDSKPVPFPQDKTIISAASIDQDTNTDYSGFFQFTLDPGLYQLQVRFTPTPLRTAAQLASIFGLLISLYLIIPLHEKKRTR